MFSDGHGGYERPVLLNVGNAAPFQCAVGDFTGDGILDIAVLSMDTVYLFRGLGGNAFAPALRVIATGNSQYFQSMVAADFNGDGFLDLAVITGGRLDVTIFNGDGKGGFTRFSTVTLDSLCFHGDNWVDVTTGTNPTMTGHGGGVWMSGRGPSSDSAGNVYFAAGNGTSDCTPAGSSCTRAGGS